MKMRRPAMKIAPEVGPLREKIDAIDDEIIALLDRRADVAVAIGRAKSAAAQPAHAPERERQVLERVVRQSSGPLPEAALRLIYKEIISASLALESPLQVAYLGPEATFTHEATKRHFGMSARMSPRRSITEVFDDVERGRCVYGVVPIENSTEGIVSHTLDSFMNSELTIGAEVLLEVSHHLLTRSGSLAQVSKVYSHPQALAQCRAWLDSHLPRAALVDVSSTARAAQLAAEDPGAAAVASDLAASMYDLQVAASNLEDLRGNMTRFLVIGQHQPPITGRDRTSLMFALRDAPGILYRALAPFAAAKINLSRIESRPSRRKAWDYLFFVDLEGHRDEAKVGRAIRELKKACVFLKVLGSYPQGTLEPRAAASARARRRT
jgi:chorismate mutase / prephenate dehydratase